MSDTALQQAKKEVVAFVEGLYRLPTMRYAIDHSMMEAWVALEGLQFSAARGWACWETLGYITGAPVRPKDKDARLGIKFPDLVSTKEDLTLWWEFKAICRLVLHPEHAGGTIALDMRALAAFSKGDTLSYHKEGRHEIARPRDDGVSLAASGLREQGLAQDHNLGVVLLFAPGEDEVVCLVPGSSPWRPAQELAKIAKNIDSTLSPHASRVTDVSDELAAAAPPTGGASALPRCHGWIVEMDG